MPSGSIPAIQQIKCDMKHSQNFSKHVYISNHPCTASRGKFWLHIHGFCTHTFTRTPLHVRAKGPPTLQPPVLSLCWFSRGEAVWTSLHTPSLGSSQPFTESCCANGIQNYTRWHEEIWIYTKKKKREVIQPWHFCINWFIPHRSFKREFFPRGFLSEILENLQKFLLLQLSVLVIGIVFYQ